MLTSKKMPRWRSLSDRADLDVSSIPGRETFPPADRHHESSPAFGLRLGATLLPGNRCEFRVWAPQRDSVELHIVAPKDRRVPLTKNNGYHEAVVDDCGEGTR